MKLRFINLSKSRKLDTIQKQQKLNAVYAIDEIGPGGANHRYLVCPVENVETLDLDGDVVPSDVIQFQCGPRRFYSWCT